jgi:hypothetical protein
MNGGQTLDSEKKGSFLSSVVTFEGRYSATEFVRLVGKQDTSKCFL